MSITDLKNFALNMLTPLSISMKSNLVTPMRSAVSNIKGKAIDHQ
jgi:hypothetical protein